MASCFEDGDKSIETCLGGIAEQMSYKTQDGTSGMVKFVSL